MVCARSIKISAQTQLSTYLLEAGVGGGDARTGAADGNGKVRTEANVSTGYQTELEDLGPRSLALGDASGDGALVQGRRRLEVGRSGLSARHAKCRDGRRFQARLGSEAGLAERIAVLSGQEAESKDGDDTHVGHNEYSSGTRKVVVANASMIERILQSAGSWRFARVVLEVMSHIST